MRLRLNGTNKAFLGFVALAVAALFVGLAWPSQGVRNSGQVVSAPTATPDPTPTATGNAIVRENAQAGTGDWQIPSGHSASTQIQAYDSATSVSAGQALTFYVSTQQEGTPYSINIYRLGWYQGLGGRLMFSQANFVGHAQGYYDVSHHVLVDCSSCHVDKQLGLVEANWQPSYTLTIPANWVTGVYLAKFTDANDMQAYAPFDVRGDPHSTYIAVTADTTYAAYNEWGGYSLYGFNSGETNTLGRGVKVSFDRPYVEGEGSGHVLAFEADAIHWFEREGYDVSYMSSVDLDENPGQLLQHRAYLSLGHDEYWTKAMRDGVQNARDHGVGLAFMGADAAYWQMRFEPDSAGVQDRTIVCYKVETSNNDLARDPLYGKNNALVTTQWRDPLLNRPENALVGIMYSGYENKERGFPWQVNAQTTSPLLVGTGLQPGKQYGCGLVGYEWDRVFSNGDTPPGLQILATSSTINSVNAPDIGDTTYYIASSGAFVFASGSIYWADGLDDYRSAVDSVCGANDPAVPGMQLLMAHIMSQLVINHRSA